MKYILYVVSLLTLISCEESGKEMEVEEEKEGVVVADYKKYFSPTAFDGKSRYYIYRETTTYDQDEPITSEAVRRLEKLDDSTLLAVEYSRFGDTIIRNDSTLMVLRKEGIHTKESFINGGEDWLSLNVNSSLVLLWNWSKGEEITFDWSTVWKNSKISLSSVRSFTGFKEQNLAGFGNVKVAIREQKQNRSRNGEKSASRVTIWDVPGLGLYRYEVIDADHSYIMEFKEEITEEEYLDILGRK